jgi:hypothetical protein
MIDSTTVFQNTKQVKNSSKDQIIIAKHGKQVEFDKCENRISSLISDENRKTMGKHHPDGGSKEPFTFSPNLMKSVPEKTVFGFDSLKDLSSFKKTIKSSYLQLNITQLTITAAFSKEEAELAILAGAKLIDEGVKTV